MLASFLRHHHLQDHIEAAAGNDVEPAWDPSFGRTYAFLRGFRAGTAAFCSTTTARSTAVSVRSGISARPTSSWAACATRALPEIYNERMAQEWAELSRVVLERFGSPLSFAGIMTQYHHRCDACGFSAHEAHRALERELAKHPRTQMRTLAGLTNIVAAPL